MQITSRTSLQTRTITKQAVVQRRDIRPDDQFQRTQAAEPSPLILAAQALLAKPQGLEKGLAGQLEALLAQVLTDPQAEAQLLGLLQQLNASGQLKPVLAEATKAAAEAGKLPPMPEAQREAYVGQVAGMIDAQFRERGMTPDTAGAVYVEWPELAARHLSAVRNSQVPPRTRGDLSALLEPAFVAELEQLQGAKFTAGNSVTPLIDGPASFAERDRLIDGASKSIHLMSWAFYDDQTGWDTARKLAAKAEEGLDVRVLVDGQLAARPHHNETIDFMEQNGVKVVRWRDSERPYDGQHRKMMIVDGESMIAGGLNVGDVYSHRAGETRWRDTDVLVQGPAVGEGSRLFAALWNEQRAEDPVSVGTAPTGAVGAARSAVVNHRPGPQGDAHILLSTMKAIEGATESVDIENAYFIQTPGMRDVMMAALDRGVRVRLLTNSAQSIDEPIISGPILSSLPELVAAGAEVYLKKGDTLHSKFMVVDGLYSSVGSYNLHPRSHRFEGEMMINSLDSGLANTLGHAFEQDIAVAQRIEKPGDIQVPESPLGHLANKYFFDQL